MKIRNGFVSNSSSSSFLVAFPRNPKSVEDVQEMVFGDEKGLAHPYESTFFSAERVSQVIWDEVKKQIPNNIKIICSRMSNLLEDYEQFETPAKHPQYPGDYDFDHKGFQEANKQEAIKFTDKNKGSFFYCFEYSDNGEGAIGCAMEHGDLFKNLSHIVSSNH